MGIRKYSDAGKLIEIGTKVAPVGRLAASFTPVGGALDAIDFARAIYSGNILDAILSGTSLILPGSYNQALKSVKVLQRNPKLISKAAKIDLGDLATRRPRFAQAIANKSDDALKLEKVYEKAASGKILSPDKAVLTLEEAEDNVLIPLLEEQSALTNPRVLLDYASRFEKVTPNGTKLVGRTLTGKRGLRGTMGKDIVKEGFKTKYGGTFASDDFATAFYYSGLGKINYSNQIYKYIKETIPNKKAQEFALEKLETIDSILQKHAKIEAKLPFLSTKKAAEGRVPYPHAPTQKLNLGMLPESLINPKTAEDFADRIKLETATEELGMFLGDTNVNGIVPIYAKIPRQGIHTGNATGQLFSKAELKTYTDSYLNGTVNKIAKMTGEDNISVIEDIIDGSILPGNDIIFGPTSYYTTRMKSGGILKRK